MKKLFFLTFLFFISCGYKPSSYYQDKIVGNEISPAVSIDIKSPQTSIFVKDALNDTIFTVFNKNISNNANTKIIIKSISTGLSILDYDENGFPILYRSKVVLKVIFIDKFNRKFNYSVSGSYDFSITSDSILDEELKLEAYKKASINALNKLLVNITKEGASYDN